MLSFWHVHESLLGELVLLEVSLVELDAALKDFDELLWWIQVVVPENVVVLWCSLLS